MQEAPVTFTHDTLHSVVNHLALIVSYADLMVAELPGGDARREDLAQIRKFALDAAGLLGRPLDAR